MVNWLDRTIGYLAPHRQLARVRARLAVEIVQRHYEGAATGRRTSGWTRSMANGSAATGPYTARLRDIARDLVRNNPYAEAAMSTIADHTVGWGIVAKAMPPNDGRAQIAWDRWAKTTACDAMGRCDMAGLQKLVIRAVAQDGEVLVRRRIRRPEDGLPLPLQLQVMEADYLDTAKNIPQLPNGGWISYGVEFSPIGQPAAYWLFPEHPGSNGIASVAMQSQQVPADAVLHVFRQNRPEQARGASWFAPVMVKIKDFDEYEDATLMKQKIAACLAVITSDVDGSVAGLGTPDDTASPPIDSLEPGMIMNVPPGRSVQVVQPPNVTDYEAFCDVNLRAIATGLGVTYEDLTGSYQRMPFSAARMSRLRHWAHVDDWRWRMLIPQFCDPVWGWAMQAAAVINIVPGGNPPLAQWTPPPMPMLEPDKEGLAITRNIRAGIQTLSDALRERGYDPEAVLKEMANDWKMVDKYGLKLDSDGRYMTQAGQLQGAGLPKPPAAPLPEKGAAA